MNVPANISSIESRLRKLAAERILVLDGAMGTMIQTLKLEEEEFRGARFDAWNREVRGNNDLLNLTRPDAIRDIHLAYLRAGADIVATNTFSSTVIAQADYGMEDIAYELNLAGAQLAREAALAASEEDGRPRFVAGAIGPTNRTASISPDVSNPGFRATSFDSLRVAYEEQARGLLDGGADLLLLETIFDTLNAKAAIYAIEELFDARGLRVPVMISGTITDRSGRMLSGLEAFTLTPEIPFVNVGERTNVTGSAKFRKLVTAGDYAGALSVARDQVDNGAQVIDVNMDEGLLDSEAAMVTFLNLVASEPDIARVPVMVDSSKFKVIEAGLKCVQGKPVVNSISMKEGEAEFIRQARIVRRHGAAVVVKAFDEKGQADTLARKTTISKRAYDILVDQVGFPPEDIIFDPNIFAIATGIEEHNGYGLAYIEAVRWIRTNLPHAHVSGGVSNLSFSFRGNEPVREAMHSVFLFHAIQAGMDMGIVNAGQMAVYDDLDR